MSHRYCIVKYDHENLYVKREHVNTSNSQLKSSKTDVDWPRYAPRPQKLAKSSLVTTYGTATPVCLTICLTGTDFHS